MSEKSKPSCLSDCPSMEICLSVRHLLILGQADHVEAVDRLMQRTTETVSDTASALRPAVSPEAQRYVVERFVRIQPFLPRAREYIRVLYYLSDSLINARDDVQNSWLQARRRHSPGPIADDNSAESVLQCCDPSTATLAEQLSQLLPPAPFAWDNPEQNRIAFEVYNVVDLEVGRMMVEQWQARILEREASE